MIQYRIGATLLSIIVITALTVLLLSQPNTVESKSKFKVIVEIDNVNSYSGEHKVKVKTFSDGLKAVTKTKILDLGELANYWDDSLVKITFTFKHSPHTFKACLESECIKGVNSPDKKPEYVRFVLK